VHGFDAVALHYKRTGTRTCDVEVNVMHVVLVVLRCYLTMVNAFVTRHNVLYDKTPFVRPLVVVDA